jgi:hypothetical protein
MKTRVSARRADYTVAGEFHITRPSLEAKFENHWKKRALFGASSTVYRDCGTGVEIANARDQSSQVDSAPPFLAVLTLDRPVPKGVYFTENKALFACLCRQRQ